MKYLVFCMILFFGTSVLAQESKRKVKIIKIDSTESYYFINGKFKCKPKGKFIIVSKRDTTLVRENRIEEKKTYNLKLSSFFTEEKIKTLPAKKLGTLLLREDGYIVWDGKLDLPYKSSSIESIYFVE